MKYSLQAMLMLSENIAAIFNFIEHYWLVHLQSFEFVERCTQSNYRGIPRILTGGKLAVGWVQIRMLIYPPAPTFSQ